MIATALRNPAGRILRRLASFTPRALLAHAVAGLSLAAHAQAPPTAPVRASKEMVVTANRYASEAGLKILHEGGNAVDAAITVQLVLSLVEPQSSGIGGGAFMLLYDEPSGGGKPAIVAYEGRETAPAAATPDMFLADNGRAASFAQVGVGGLSVGVPGVLRMLELAHREHGKLPWGKLFEPAIELADQGFVVSVRLHALLDGFKRFARVRKTSGATSTTPPESRYRRARSSRIPATPRLCACSPPKAPSRCTRASSRPRSCAR